MLSMTQSTESKEKKEIWGNRVQTQGGTLRSTLLAQIEPPCFTHSCLAGMNWRANSLLQGIHGHPLGAGHLPPSGQQTLAPTTRVNGRFQDTMPTTPENASWGQSGWAQVQPGKGGTPHHRVYPPSLVRKERSRTGRGGQDLDWPLVWRGGARGASPTQGLYTQLTENPAQEGQDLLMLSVVVTEEATMLKVTTRMPRSTWASPSVSRACSQGRWRRRWVRPLVLGRLVSERLESLGEGIMPAARLPEPCSTPTGAWEHLRGAQGPVFPPLHPPSSRAQPLAGSPGTWPRDSSWVEARGRGVTEGPWSAPSPPRALYGHRAGDGEEDTGAPAHLISLGKRGAEKGRSGSEETAAVRNPREGGEGKGEKDGKEV